MTDAFEDLREQIETRLVVPPFDEIRRRRTRKTQIASVFASAAAVTVIVAGAALVTAPRGGQADELGAAAPAQPSASASADSAIAPSAGASTEAAVEQPVVDPGRPPVPAGDGRMYLVTAPGWKVTRVDESYPPDGEMTFEAGARRLDLHWRAASTHASYVEDRAQSSGPPAPIEIDGTEGTLFLYKGTPNDHTALWLVGEYSFELRGNATEAQFRAVAATVKAVAPATWLIAMPKSAVVPDQRAATIAEMRKAIPTPPGFDETRLAGEGVADRYQLGALVAGQLACGWFDEWIDADKVGDTDRRTAATAVLENSKTWPVLLSMVDEGDYAEVLWEYADALDGRELPAGTSGVTIRDGGYVDGLGCNRP